MIDTSYWAMGTGVTMIGVGLALYYEGQALQITEATRIIGKKAFGYGIGWIVMGAMALLVGFFAWLMITYSTLKPA